MNWHNGNQKLNFLIIFQLYNEHLKLTKIPKNISKKKCLENNHEELQGHFQAYQYFIYDAVHHKAKAYFDYKVTQSQSKVSSGTV